MQSTLQVELDEAWARLGEVSVWLDALSQSAWSTGAGWGLMLAYAVYASADMRAGRECADDDVQGLAPHGRGGGRKGPAAGGEKVLQAADQDLQWEWA